MTKLDALLGIACLSACVADDDATVPPAPAPEPAPVVAPRIVEQMRGRWLEEPLGVDEDLQALCGDCRLAIVHDIAERDGDVIDTITVRADDGTIVCRRERAYVAAAVQPYADGQLVDYRMTVDTCASQFAPETHAAYAMWIASNRDAIEVMEDVPGPGEHLDGFRPFDLWSRIAIDRSGVPIAPSSTER